MLAGRLNFGGGMRFSGVYSGSRSIFRQGLDRASFKGILEQLKGRGPGFSLKASNIEILDGPEDYFHLLKAGIFGAKNRICLSSLYLGSDCKALELMDLIFHSLEKRPHLRLVVLLDYLRSTRASGPFLKTILFNRRQHLSAAMSKLHSLKRQFPQRVSIYFYHTPELNGISKALIPDRVKELVGVQHIKSYIFDGDLLISGANLGELYFTNRQDRYMWFRNADPLSNTYFNLIETIGSFSYELDERGRLSSPSPHDPVSDPEDFKLFAKSKLLEVLNGPSSISDSDDTIVFPTLQLGPCGIDHDRKITHFVFDLAIHNPNRFFLSSPYFNFTEDYKSKICDLSEKSEMELIVSSPECNGFYNAGPISGMIPSLYNLVLEKFYDSFVNRHKRRLVKICEYHRKDWTFHSKGIWLDLSQGDTLFVTLVGSSNFGFRSVNRDLESQLLLLTKNKDIKNRLIKETENIRHHSKLVADETFQNRNGRSIFLTLASRLAARFM